jgi:thiosulfate reductase cytochrome b subunit
MAEARHACVDMRKLLDQAQAGSTTRVPDFHGNLIYFGTVMLVGLAIVVFSGLAVYMPKAWEEVLNILLGVGLAPQAAPDDPVRPPPVASQ